MRPGTVTQPDPSYPAGTLWDYIVAAYAPAGTIDVQIEGFTIDANGQNRTAGTYEFTAVFLRDVYAADLTAGVFDSTIENFGTARENDGIRIFGDSNLAVDGNVLSGYTFGGIVAEGDRGDAADPYVVISGNSLTGVGTTNSGILAQNGVMVAFGATGTISGNTIKDHTGPAGAAHWSIGIYVRESEQVLISDNLDISDNMVGIYIYQADNNTVSRNVVSGGVDGMDVVASTGGNYIDNRISGATSNGIYLWDGDTNTISGNIISDVHSGSGSGWSIAPDGADASTGSGDNMLSGNTVQNSDVGIWIGNGSDNAAVTGNTLTGNLIGVQTGVYGGGVAPAGLSLSDNIMSNNDSQFVFDGATTVTLSTPPGPVALAADVVQQMIGDNRLDRAVNITQPDGILRSESLDGEAVVYVRSSIQDSIAAATEGDTVNVADGMYVTPSQVVIDKTLSIVGQSRDNTIVNPGFDTGASGDARGGSSSAQARPSI